MTAALRTALGRRQRHQAFQTAVRTTLRVPRGLWNLTTDDTVVCRCENVKLRDIRSALDAGHSSLNAVKRNVRSGMGWCGGRTCLRAVAALSELHAGIAPPVIMTPRPMVRPITFGAVVAQKKAVDA
jgi:NAD(P)H-nitrite reductase large subunit